MTNVEEKLYQICYIRKEDFIQSYCNTGGRLNSIPLKQKMGGFLNARIFKWGLGVGGEVGECD